MLCIAAMWLNSEVADAEASLENYYIFRGERWSGMRMTINTYIYVLHEMVELCGI